MCGIVFGRRKDGKPIWKSIAKRYEDQKSRGKEGFGFIAIEDHKLVDMERFTTEQDCLKSLQGITQSEILFHHRYPTSTDNIEELNHPIAIKSKVLDFDYYVVHNGVITNAETLKAKHENLGLKYSTEVTTSTVLKTLKREIAKEEEFAFNDSESLAMELALFIEGKQNNIDTRGSIAFILYQVEKKTSKVVALFFGRNSGSPLKLEGGIKNDLFFLKSEGKGEEVIVNALHRLDYKTNILTIQNVEIGKTYAYSGYQGTYPNKDKEPFTNYEGYDDYANDDYGYGKHVTVIDHDRQYRDYATQYERQMSLLGSGEDKEEDFTAPRPPKTPTVPKIYDDEPDRVVIDPEEDVPLYSDDPVFEDEWAKSEWERLNDEGYVLSNKADKLKEDIDSIKKDIKKAEEEEDKAEISGLYVELRETENALLVAQNQIYELESQIIGIENDFAVA